MSENAYGMTAPAGALRQTVLLVGLYAAALCWVGAAIVAFSTPGASFAIGWFLTPPALLTLGVWVVWLRGRERPPRRAPLHLHRRGRHAVRPSGAPAPPPRSAFSKSLLTVSVYTAALAWGGSLFLAWNGVAYVLGSIILAVPLLATLFAIFASAYRGRLGTKE